MQKSFFITLIEHGSDAYRQMVRLRTEVLLKPIGIEPSYIKPEAEKADVLIGAFAETDVIGCCILTERGNHAVQLRQMAVRPDFQGNALGRALVAYAEETARAQHFQSLMLHARSNVVPFYQKCGYAIVGAAFEEVGIEHYRMEKAL